jgi:hypothetical protein
MGVVTVPTTPFTGSGTCHPRYKVLPRGSAANAFAAGSYEASINMDRFTTIVICAFLVAALGTPCDLRGGEVSMLRALQEGEPYDFSSLQGSFELIKRRGDTADFRLQPLARIVYDHGDSISSEEFQHIKEVFLGFKYWMDQPGRDGMCYWSENHQIMFSAAEYLAGQRWPDEIFINDGKTGAKHRDMARQRILHWLEQRWLYGFTEWYSNVYYVEDIAPLANLIDFAEDREIVKKATIVMDLLLHDLATQSHRGVFLSTSGRMYDGKKKGNRGNSMRAVVEHIWGQGAFGYESPPRQGMDLCFIYCKNYRVPEVIRAIGLDPGPSVIRASTGLNISELKGEDLIGQEDRQIMMQWAMEAFTNPQVIDNSIRYIERNDMFHNKFLQGFQMIDIDGLREYGLLPTVSILLRPQSNGSAIQRANTYTYRTPDFMIATSQAYHPGTFGDQHHIWTATLSEEVSLFTTHPAEPLMLGDTAGNSPGYWVGSGRLPHCVQHRNIVVCMYDLDDKPGFLEQDVADFTHAYFPMDKLADVEIDGRFAFARHRNTLVAFVTRYPLEYAEGSQDDLIQAGVDGYWIFEASTLAEEGSMEAFQERIRSNAIACRDRTLQYTSGGDSLQVSFGGDFCLNGSVVDTEYPRFASPYANCQRRPQSVRISCDGHVLELDFQKRMRVSRASISPQCPG